MSMELTYEELNHVFDSLRTHYKIYAPKRLKDAGRYSYTDIVRYQEIHKAEEIELEDRGDYSPKEVFYPINQTLFHFTESNFLESQVFEKDLLIFARACDINGIKRLDKVFLENAHMQDPYYKRMRKKVHFALLECKENGWESCACCSMGTNTTQDYDVAIRFLPEENRVLIKNKTDVFTSYLQSYPQAIFEPEFVKENQTKVKIPEITEDQVAKIRDLDMWKDYQTRCIGCGACNAVCITCSCFNTTDTPYTQNGKSGERRRTWTGCMNDGFTTVNGGNTFRDEHKDRMRFKTMHKMYDFKKRFETDYQMCVGCGRCDDICPAYISFSHIVNRLHDEVEQMKEGNN